MMFVPFIVINLVEGHYHWALILFVLAGLSDGLDGLLARTLKQQTMLGQYLDPIAVLYAIAGLRDFRPSIFGKANTLAQVAAIFFVMLLQVDRARWVWIAR